MLYIPPAFQASDADALSLIRDNPFATLISIEGEQNITHMPMYLSSDQRELMGHFAGANPHQKVRGLHQHTAIFKGPDAYISAGWYQDPEQVPTWNYQVVHVTGTLRLIEDTTEKLAIVDGLTEIFEASFEPKWTTDKMSESRRDQMLTHITGCALNIEKIEAKFKLSQNKGAQREELIRGLASKSGNEKMIKAMSKQSSETSSKQSKDQFK